MGNICIGELPSEAIVNELVAFDDILFISDVENRFFSHKVVSIYDRMKRTEIIRKINSIYMGSK